MPPAADFASLLLSLGSTHGRRCSRLTRHALRRAGERHIPVFAIGLVLRFGRALPHPRGYRVALAAAARPPEVAASLWDEAVTVAVCVSPDGNVATVYRLEAR